MNQTLFKGTPCCRTVLINSSLSSLLLFLVSFYTLPKTLHHEIATVQARFFWAGDGDKQKYHMVRWSEICKPRDHGGLGIMSSKRINIALLTRWLWRISRGEGGLWLRIIQPARPTSCLLPAVWGFTILAVPHPAALGSSHWDLYRGWLWHINPVLV
ncbi:putative TdLSC37 protein [Hordeum vulgare]|nr:putative TdLSC37 protein [Hordeum vulgare]